MKTLVIVYFGILKYITNIPFLSCKNELKIFLTLKYIAYYYYVNICFNNIPKNHISEKHFKIYLRFLINNKSLD